MQDIVFRIEWWFPRKRIYGFLTPDSRDTDTGLFNNTNALANRSLSDSDKAVKKVPDKIISKYYAIKKIRTPGITYCGSNLIVNDEIILLHMILLRIAMIYI